MTKVLTFSVYCRECPNKTPNLPIPHTSAAGVYAQVSGPSVFSLGF